MAPLDHLAVHTEDETQVFGIAVMVEEGALVKEDFSDVALVRGVAGVEGMAGKDHMEPGVGPQTLALMP